MTSRLREIPYNYTSFSDREIVIRAVYGDSHDDPAIEIVARDEKKNPLISIYDWTEDATKRIMRVPAGWVVRVQCAIALADSEPEPDAAVFRGSPRDYPSRHPGPKDAALIAEVANSSLQRDTGQKKRLYARARVPQYWIVNLIDEQIEVHSNPAVSDLTAAYQTKAVYVRGESVPLVLDGRATATLELSLADDAPDLDEEGRPRRFQDTMSGLDSTSAFFFDIGVFALVVGAIGLILIALAHQSGRHPWS